MTVVVGYLPTREGAAALEAALAQARHHGLRLVIVNVARPAAAIDPRDAAPASLDAVARRLADTGLAHEICHLTGDAAGAILQVADEAAATLIVLGLRRSPLGKFAEASTAQQVILEARCAVLAVKPAGRP